MQPILRLTDYIEEYKTLTYSYYSKTGNIVYTTYYQLDHEKTVYDDAYEATYRKYGQLSGRKWNKIHLLPLMFIQQESVASNGSEKGVSFNEDINTISGTIDPSVGLTPHIGDVLYFNISNVYSFWEVTNLEKSGTFDNPYYKITLKQVRLEESMLLDNVNKEYIYIEFLKKIYLYELGETYIKLNNRLHILIDHLNRNKYLHNASCHVENAINYIELDQILCDYDSNKPFANTLLVENYGVYIHDDGVINLLCMPDMFDLTKTIVYTFKKSCINPRANLYAIYDEYITDDTGTLDIIETIYPTISNDVKSEIDNFVNCLRTAGTFTALYTTPFSNLLSEWCDYLLSANVDHISDTFISTNVLENIMEYCIISRKLITISDHAVTLS